MIEPTERLSSALARWRAGGAPRVVVLTGAGISAESGIPTFRGADGYWTVGSTNYSPQELATAEAFRRMPETVWGFYLERIRRHGGAEPNAAHAALVRLERELGDAFTLVTQNVDGLHLRAGNTRERTFQIHGCLDFVRCFAECSSAILPLPDAALAPDARPRPGDVRAVLGCAACGGWLRPHVLWFDEFYDEERYRYESSLRAVAEARLLLVVGTSGATNLPARMVELALLRGIPLIVVDPERTAFGELAERSPSGVFVRGTAVRTLPGLVAEMLAG